MILLVGAAPVFLINKKNKQSFDSRNSDHTHQKTISDREANKVVEQILVNNNRCLTVQY